MKHGINYQSIYQTYGLQYEGKKFLENVHDCINRVYEKSEYKDKTWEQLSPDEQDFFIYIDIYERMLKNYFSNPEDAQTLEKQRELDYKKQYLAEMNEILSHNRAIKHLYDTRQDYEARVAEVNMPQNVISHKAYNSFRRSLSEFATFQKIELCPPSEEEWLKLENGYRIYDIYMDYLDSSRIHYSTDKIDVPQTEINHVILQTIVKALKDVCAIEIDVTAIKECLSLVYNSTLENTELYPRLSSEDDDVKQKGQELFTEYILKAQNRIKNADFYVYNSDDED